MPRPVSRQRKSRGYSVAAPIGGWNARDPLAMMKPEDAIRLDNWFPQASDVITRKGAESWATGFSEPVKSLLAYNKADGTAELFAATDTGIYDVTATGAIGAAEIGLTEGYAQHINIIVAGTSYLMVVNGTDELKLYNGTTWQSINGASTPAITGITTSDIVGVALHKRRVFFVKKDSLSFYYLPVLSVGGAAVEYPLDSLCARGGYLMALGTWTLDAGSGADDYLVAITSEGEVVVFSGTDPSSVSAWSMVGVYYLGSPMGRRCLMKFGGDLIALTQAGAFPLSKALLSSTINYRQALTSRIDQAFAKATSSYRGYVGWESLPIPRESMLLFNIPTNSLGGSEQYVMNTVTGAWCRFTGWKAYCFALSDDELYFGAVVDGAYIVAKGLSGYTDFGAAIVPYVKQASDYFKSRGISKQITLIRPNFSATGLFTIGLRLDADFDDPYYTSGMSVPASTSAEALWGSAVWGSATWASSSVRDKNWRTVASRPGYCFSLAALLYSVGVQVTWSATEYQYVPTGGL